ncbi:type VII secretion protein EsaA [Cellulomonas sp. Y8]|uniref:type VII secretion protein EsaA n=1 Tax=Cellulomonas sp. Y8 TaxID=2591145 RepID=UPI00143D1C32|nr:type VII secretion protein EsaA [Cellulomonas sp. Y8]
MNSRLARLLVVLVFTVGLTASVLLPLNSEYQEGLATAGAQAARPVSLNIALVNEDRGAEAGGEQVNLGRAYVRQIESDTSAVWRVVSRGVAESGLAQGSYHVLVLIPAEFSEKLLDLEAEEPGPIGITYQVNGNGNARVETVADSRARGIVGQLNGQLVDMYVASILGNLRQAQENVRLVADAEAGHVGVLVEEVDPAARAIGTGLSDLTHVSEGSVTAHLGLVDALDRLGGDLRSGVESASAHDGSLADLLSAREAGALTYGAFLESLLATDARLLSDEVQHMYDELVATSDSLRGQLDTDGSGNHVTAVGSVRELTDEAEASVAGRARALGLLGPDRILEEYGATIRSALGADQHGVLSLAAVLRFAQESGSTSGDEPEFVPWLAELVAARIAVLPYRSQGALDAAVDEGVFEHASGQFEDVASDIRQDLAEVMTWAGHADVPVSPDGVVGGDLDVVIADLLDALPSGPDPDPEPATEPDPDADPTEGDGDPAHPADPAPDVAAPAARYGATLTRVAAAYERAAELVRLAHGCATTCGLPADADVVLAVDAVITMAVQQQITSERLHLVGARELADRMVDAADELAWSLALLQATRETLSENVVRQLDSLADLRSSMAEIREGERTAARSVAESDALTRSVAVEARGLLGTSESLAASALVGADHARRVADLMRGLRADVDRLLGDAADLDERSDLLTRALVGQVDDSQAFADSFGGVLSNAHSAGVLNERLLRFLVDPVEPQGREPVVSADVTRPFPWVLIVFSVCFVSGYLVSGVTDGRRQRSAFARRGAQWLAPNARALGTASLVGALLGIGLAWASGADLGVPRESQLTWSAAVVLSAVGLTVLAHWSVRQLRSSGVGLCLLTLVGYVFVSDAVGTGVTSGLSAAVAAVNPLSHTESTLSAVLGGEPGGVVAIAPLLLVLAVGAVLDLLVQDDLSRLLPRRRRAVPA